MDDTGRCRDEPSKEDRHIPADYLGPNRGGSQPAEESATIDDASAHGNWLVVTPVLFILAVSGARLAGAATLGLIAPPY